MGTDNPVFQKQCMGCTACVRRCPVHAMYMEEDEEGFAYARRRLSSCVECGLCEEVCPVLHLHAPVRPLKEMAVRHLDEAVRMGSSSGGVFSALAEAVFLQGGVVFGARFDEDWRVVMDYTESMEGLKPFCGSKYVEAEVGDSYHKAAEFLKQGRWVMYVSTPCRIAGLKGYLGKEYECLITVGLGCRSVPPRKAWLKFLREHTCPPVRSVVFRSKIHGWRRYVMCIEDKRGTRKWHRIRRGPLLLNTYIYAYSENLMMRPSCTCCHYKEGASGADLVMGDFWHIKDYFPEWDDNKGVSYVAVFSERGARLIPFQRIHWLTLPDSSSYMPRNVGFSGSCKPHPCRHEFLVAMDGEVPFDKQVRQILQPPLLPWAMHKIKQMMTIK